MTETEILNYFNNTTVYRFKGSEKEFKAWQPKAPYSMNYIIVSGTVYFVSQGPVEDNVAEALLER